MGYLLDRTVDSLRREDGFGVLALSSSPRRSERLAGEFLGSG
jgi:hypothetical protein